MPPHRRDAGRAVSLAASAPEAQSPALEVPNAFELLGGPRLDRAAAHSEGLKSADSTRDSAFEHPRAARVSQIVESTADIGRELRRLPSFLPTLDRPRRIRVERVRLGVRVVRTPAAAPNCNAHAERFVRSIKEECLDRIIPIGERHFQHVITEFVEHYHRERNHQGLDNRLIAGTPMTDRTGRVRCRRRLGGLLNFYERAA